MPASPEGERKDVRHGCQLYTWPGIAGQLDALRREVRRLAALDPKGYTQHPKAKLLAAVRRLLLDVIPADSRAPEFQLGNTLGPEYRQWRRAKFSGRFRLFFRFHSASRSIVYVWMNDEGTLRKAGGRTDPYGVFHQMLGRGRPPSDWADLLRESNALADE
jgi:toxin YhaV